MGYGDVQDQGEMRLRAVDAPTQEAALRRGAVKDIRSAHPLQKNTDKIPGYGGRHTV